MVEVEAEERMDYSRQLEKRDFLIKLLIDVFSLMMKNRDFFNKDKYRLFKTNTTTIF